MPIPPTGFHTRFASPLSFGDLFTSPEPGFDILLSTRWNGQFSALVQAELVGFKYGLTAPRPLRNSRAMFAGIVVERFPKQACQTLVEDLAEASMLQRPATESFGAIRGTKTVMALRRLFEKVVHTRKAVPLLEQPRINDLRVLLAKELRYLVKHGNLAWSDRLTSYYKAEELARRKLAGKFMENMQTVKEDYELRVLVRAAETSDVGIQKIFLVDVLSEFPTVLLEEDFFSSKLQDFFSSILQYPRSRVTMDREAMDALFQTHMQTKSASSESLTNDLFKHVNDPDQYFHSWAKSLFVDVLALVWNYYYEHSQGMLQILYDKKEAFDFLLEEITRLPEMTAATEVGPEGNRQSRVELAGGLLARKAFSLDAFGFGTILHLASWQATNNYGHLAVVQGTCRFAYIAVARSEVKKAASVDNSAVISTRFDATFQPPPSGIFTGTFYRTKKPFSSALYRRLKTWNKLGRPREDIRIRHLTTAMATKLRQNVLEAPEQNLQATWDFASLFGPSQANFIDSFRAAAEACFDSMFVNATSSLRPLFNIELAHLVARRSTRADETPLHPKKQALREVLRARLVVERFEATKQFSERLRTTAEDPNENVVSFRIQPKLIETILERPFFYDYDVLNSIELISSIPELSDVRLALQISIRGLLALHRLLNRSPLTLLNYKVAKWLHLYTPVGAQDSMRHSFISRLNTVMKLAWQFHSRSFDNHIDLLPATELGTIREKLIQAGLAAPAEAPRRRALYGPGVLPEAFDSSGFTTALALVAAAELKSTPIEYLDETGRLFSVTCRKCRNERESFIATSKGLVRVPSPGLPVAVLALPSTPPDHQFSGLKIWEAPRASIIAPRAPRPHHVRRILSRLQSFFGAERRVSHLTAAVTEAVIARAELPNEHNICTTLSRSFPSCLVQPILNCDAGDQICRNKIDAVSADFEDMFDRLWLEISSARFSAERLRAEAHWRLLSPALVNLVRANSPDLSPEEYRLLTTTDPQYAQSAEGRTATRMLWIRLILKQPQQLSPADFARLQIPFEEFGRGAPVPTKAIQQIANYYKEEIAAAAASDSQLGEEAESALEAATNKARKEFASLGIYEATDKRLLRKVLLDLYHLRHESLFDFLLGSLPTAEDFPPIFRSSLTACLLAEWRSELEFDRMMGELEQLSGLPALTPHTVKDCFTKATAALETESPREGEQAPALIPAQVPALANNSYFLFLTFYRFKSVLEALEMFRALRRPREREVLETVNLQQLTENVRLLTKGQFRGLLRRTPGFCEFAYALVAARTRKDLYILEAPSRRALAGRILRIGAASTGLLSTRAQRSVSVLCVPFCHVVGQNSLSSFDLVGTVAAEAKRQISERAVSLRQLVSGVVPKLAFLAQLPRSILNSAGKLLPAQNQVFVPGESSICSETESPVSWVFVVKETCAMTKVSKAYFLEALTLTLGIGQLNPLAWLRFWLAGNDVLLGLAKEVLQAKRAELNSADANNWEAFVKDPEWRRMVPAIYAEVVLRLNNSLSSFREVVKLLRWIRPATRAVKRSIASILRFFEPVREEKKQKEGAAAVKVERLPDVFFMKNWRSFSICMDNGEDGLEFSTAYRLVAAIGTSLRAAQRFPTESSLMYGSVRGERSVMAAFNRMAVDYFIGRGGVHDSAKKLIEHMLLAILHECERSASSADMAGFCESARACRGTNSKKSRMRLTEVECVMKSVQDVLASDHDPGRLHAVLNMFTGLFEELGHRVAIWSQPLNKLFTFETTVQSVADSFAIQLIVGPGGPATVEGSPPGCALYVVSPAFSLKTQLEMASHHREGAGAPTESYSAEAIEVLDLFLQEQAAAVEATHYVSSAPFDSLAAIVDRIVAHPELDSLNVLVPAQLTKVLGLNPENEELIMQQSEFIDDSLRPHVGAAVVDLEILRNLTMRQALHACTVTQRGCPNVLEELERRVSAALNICQEKAEHDLLSGVRRGQRKKLLTTIEDIRRTLSTAECDAGGCRVVSKADVAFRALSKFYAPAEFRAMYTQIFDVPIPAAATDLGENPTKSVDSVRSMLTLPQWATILTELNAGVASRVASASQGRNFDILEQIRLFKRTCFDVAQRRLRDSLAVIQMTVKRNAPSWASEIELEFEQRERHKKQIMNSVLNDCCSREKFAQQGATVAAHQLIKGLRSRGLATDWAEVFENLTDNRLSHITWMQQAVNIDVRKMGDNERGMMQSCHEEKFWKLGATACTALFLKRMRSRGFRMTRYTPVTKGELEDLKQTYEEWMDKARNVLLVEKKAGHSIMKIDRYANAEAKIWVRIAEALYARPNSTWPSVRQTIVNSGDRVYLTVLGRKKAHRLFGAVQGKCPPGTAGRTLQIWTRSLHRAVSYVKEKHFNQFGAFLVTDALVRRLREQNIFDAGNSAITIGNIKRIRTFAEWKRKVLLLKVSTEMIRTPIPVALVQSMGQHRHLVRLLKWFSKSKSMTNIIRTSVLSIARLALGPALSRIVNPWKATKAADAPDGAAGGVSAALVTGLVMSSIFLDNYFGVKLPVILLLLPPIISFVKSYSMKNLLEQIIDSIELPELATNILEPFFPRLEQFLVKCIRDYLTVDFLDGVIRQYLSSRFNLDALKLSSKIKDVAEFLVKFIRRRGPVVLTTLKRYFVSPTLQDYVRILKDFVVTVVTTGADAIANRLLYRPRKLHPALFQYIVRGPSLTDAVGLKDFYEVVLAVFRDRTLAAINPTIAIPPEVTAALTPLEKIIAFGMFPPAHAMNPLGCPSLTEKAWQTQTKKYKLDFYPTPRVAVTGFVGELRLTVLHGQREVPHLFLIKEVKGMTLSKLKKMRGVLKQQVLVFEFKRHRQVRDVGEIVVRHPVSKMQCTLSVRFGSLFAEAVQTGALVEELNKTIPGIIQHLQSISSEGLEDILTHLATHLPGIESPEALVEETRKMIERKLFTRLLQYEYLSEPNWFALDFGLTVTLPREDDAAAAAGPTSVELTVLVGEHEVAKSYLVSVFDHQTHITQLDQTVKKRCGVKPTLLQRIQGHLGLRRRTESTVRCIKIVEFSTDQSGRTWLSLSWKSDNGYVSQRFMVTPTNNPDMTKIVEQPAERPLSDENLEDLRTRIAAASAHGGNSYDLIHWAAFTVLFKNSLINASYRRQRREFRRVMSATSDSGKKVFRERDYLDSEIFGKPQASLNPAWMISLDALLRQPKYQPLVEMLGDKLHVYKEALALALSNISTAKSETLTSGAELVTAERLSQLCPQGLQETAESRDICEQNNGMWGSLWITDRGSPLLRFIGKKKMKTPALFKYWLAGGAETAAKYAVGDLDEVEQFQHSRHDDITVKIVALTVVSQQLLLQLYDNYLEAEATGRVKDTDEKYQVLKYAHISLLRLLRTYASVSGEQNASVPEVLRNAAQAVLNTVEPAAVLTAEEKYTWTSMLEAHSEQVYRDMEISFGLRELSFTLKTPAAGVADGGRPRYMVYLMTMLHQNPYVDGTGYQSSLQDPAIRQGCSASPVNCPSPEVLWNHVYTSLLVMVQLAPYPDMLEHLLSARNLDFSGRDDPLEPLNFDEAMSLFQYGVSIIAKWKVTPEVEDYFSGKVDLQWIRRMLSLFDDDETLRVLIVYTPPLHLRTTVLQNPRVVLQKATWNALVALWGFRGAFGRFVLEVRNGWKKQVEYGVPYGLATSDMDSLRMPLPVREFLETELRELMADEANPGMPVLVLESPGMKVIDNALLDLVPVFRRAGQLPVSHPLFLQLMRNVRSYLHTMRAAHGAKFAKEKLLDATVRTRFLSIIREAALKAAFMEQLQIDLPQKILWSRNQFFHINNMAKISEDFSVNGVMPSDYKERLEELFPIVCDTISASSTDAALSILGVDIAPIVEFREKVIHTRQLLRDVGAEVPVHLQHHPIEKFILVARCEPIRNLPRKHGKVEKACTDLENTREKVLSNVSFTAAFRRQVAEVEASLAERVNCGVDTEDGQILQKFFVQLMEDATKNAGIIEYWDRFMALRETSFDTPAFEPLTEAIIASVLHKLALHARSGTLDADLENSVYPTVCKFMSYVRRARGGKPIADFCRTFPAGRPLLSRFFQQSKENQIMRLELNSFAFTRGPNAMWMDDFSELAHTSETLYPPRNSAVISFFRMVRAASSTPQSAEADALSVRRPSAFVRSLSEVADLVLDKLRKKRNTMNKWSRRLVTSILRVVDAAILLAIQAVQRFAATSRRQIAMAREEIKVQRGLERRVSISSRQDGVRGRQEGSVAAPPAAPLPEDERRPSAVAMVQVGVTSVTSMLYKRIALELLKVHRYIPGWVASALGTSTKDLAFLLRTKATVPGSVKDIAMSTCVNIFDNIVLPTLTKPNVLAPETMIRNVLAQLTSAIHYTVMPNLGAVEEKFRRARSQDGMLPLSAFLHGIVLSAVTQLESLMQNNKWQTEMVRLVQEHIRTLNSAVIGLVKRFRLADALCGITDPLLDAVADVVERNARTLAHLLTDLMQADTFGLLINFVQAQLFKELRLAADSGEVHGLLQILSSTGFLNLLADGAKGLYYVYNKEQL
ncbi:hypothetical protein NCLIV_039500 [Neospora caninum Liverpool]|nr:hypothetical protein NCLIV_039500 [Neospora caninum Liverpool]CBZ50875.1 hypothetical protein NCLIV_039500 [Neospora caninum Liverpool]|eukprot:XP_003880908.1 hypothetical protein NCLIV_039500 [Neospora caninum Liverpool]